MSAGSQQPPRGGMFLALSRGARWSSGSLLIISAIQIVRVVLLGRILGPEAFGLLAMMLVFVSLAELLILFGLNEAIIQESELSDVQRSTLYWVNVALGLVCYAIFWFLTPLIAAIYSTPELERYLPWLATTFLIMPWGAQIRALLQKRLEFSPQSIIDVIGTLTGALLSIVLALAGAGVWSLVAGHVAQILVITLALFGLGRSYGLLPQRVIDIRQSLPLLAFGFRMTLSNTVGAFNARVDQFLIGTFLGSQALGYYALAFSLVVDPFIKINGLVTKLAFPALARIRSDAAQVRSAFFRMLDLLSALYTPLLFGAAILAPDAVPLFLGPEWSEAVVVVQLLAVFALVRSINGAGAAVVMSFGEAGRLLAWNLLLALLVPLGLYLGIRGYGLRGAAGAQIAIQLLLVPIWYLFCLRPLLGACARGYLKSLLPSVAIGAVMSAAVGLLLLVWQGQRPAILLILLSVALGGCVYLAVHWWLRRGFSREALAFFLTNR